MKTTTFFAVFLLCMSGLYTIHGEQRQEAESASSDEDRQTAEIRRLQSLIAEYIKTISSLRQQIRELEQQNARLRQELAKYQPEEHAAAEAKEEHETSDRVDRHIQFVAFKATHHPEQFRTTPYERHIRLYFQFRNNTQKTLTGLQDTVQFLNSFGETIHRTSAESELKIEPGKSNAMDKFFYYEDNPFIDDEPYDKLIGAVQAETLKVNITLSRAAFSDGSIINFDKDID